MCTDARVLSELDKMLQTADVSTICLRNKSVPETSSMCPLQQQLLQRNPNIFSCTSAATPAPRPSLSPAAAQPVLVVPSEVKTSRSDAAEASLENGRTSAQQSLVDKEDEGLSLATPPHPKRRRTITAKAPEPIPDVASTAEVAAELDKAVGAFLVRDRKQHATEEVDTADGEARSDIECDDEEEDDGCRRPMLQHLRRLSEVLLKAHTAAAMHLIPPEHHLQLLKVLSRYLLQGRDRVLHPDEQESSEEFTAIIEATEASVACLYVLTSADMPKQVYQEDIIEAIMDGVKFNLLSNVLAFHDARLCAAHRPHMTAEADEDADVGTSSGRKLKSASKSASKRARRRATGVPGAVDTLASRLESVLELLGKLLGVVQLQANMVLPLLRTACQVLTVEGMDILQVKSVGLLVAGFRRFKEQRQALLDEVMTAVLPNLPASRSLRKFVVGNNNDAAILAASVELPSLEVAPSALRDCYAPVMHWADVFWTACLSRLGGVRAHKAEGDMDMKNMLEQMVIDVLLMHSAPEWPAALPMLLRLISALNSKAGLLCPDNAVRQFAVDLLGFIAAQLCYESKRAATDMPAVNQILEECEASDDKADLGRQLLLGYLADRRHGDAELCSSAREFMLCQTFADDITDLQKADAPVEQQVAALVGCRETCDVMSRGTTSSLTAEDACMLVRWAAHSGPLGRMRVLLLKKLADAADPTKQTAAVRAKAIKAITTVVKSDTSVLSFPEIQHCVHRALKDEAPSVRQATVDLLGGHIGADVDLASAYFDTLVTASRDTSTSVRKAAVRILWESCIRVPDFPRASEACVAVLHRVGDNEESILDLVSKIFHGLWFADSQEGSAPGAAARARQLADVSLFVYEAGGTTIHLPLESSHALVAVLKKALEREGKERPGKEWVAGRELARALLEGLLNVGEGGGDAEEQKTFPYLVALHALCLTDVSLCTPAEDPCKYIRCLAPYLKVTPSSKAGQSPGKQAAERREAECLLCILAIVDSILSEVVHLNKALVMELQNDLLVLINKHFFIQVVSAACKALAALAKHAPSAGSLMTCLAQTCLSLLQEKQHAASTPAFCSRYLYVLGQLLRYGMDAIEATQLPKGQPVTISNCQATCLSFCTSPAGDLKVRESALQTLGCLGIARPSTLLAAKAQSVMKSALQPSAPTILKTRALTNLTELLKAEEERLASAQQASEEKQKVGRLGAGDAVQPLPTQNGEGDSLSMTNGILQTHWDLVLALATDATPPQARPGASRDPGDPLNASVRRHAVAVMDAVDRNGLVAPWTALPHLFALTTDPNSEVSARALRIMRRVAEKHAEMFQTCLASGLKVTADFHERIRSNYGTSTSSSAGVSEEVVSGLGALYMELVQPSRPNRTNFLASLLKPFDAACNLHLPPASPSDLRLLALCAHLAAMLPYKRADEPLVVVYHVNTIVSRRGEDVLSALKASLAGSSSLNAQEGDVETQCRASLALCMLLLLKQHLKSAYGLTTERITNFNPGLAETRKQEESKSLGQVPIGPLDLEGLHLNAASTPALLQKQYTVFKALMKADSCDYGEDVTLGRRKSSKAAPAAANGDEDDDTGADAAAGATPAIANGRLEHMQGSAGPATTTGLEGRRSGRPGRGRGGRSASRLGTDARCTVSKRRGGSTGGKPGRRKAARAASSDEDDADLDNGDEDYVADGRRAARRRLEPMLVD
ncbi:Nipped-B-like protein [Coccomyxa sp. Obi]|nr:Nipped-B-like protein [Coccomyxa sp. Obi]